MKKFIKTNWKYIVITFVYAIVTFFVTLNHVTYRDEAQAWLIAKENNLGELFNSMKYEGHYMLWYMMIAPFAKMGLPFECSKYISLVIMIITVWLILKKMPGKLYMKALVIFVTPIVYLYPTVTRSYSLFGLAMIFIALTYEKRREKPFRYMLSLWFMANLHIMMTAFVGMQVLEFLYEIVKEKENIKKRIIAFILFCILMIISILPLIGCLGANTDIAYNNKDIINSIVSVFANGIVFKITSFLSGLPNLTVLIFSILIFAIMLLDFKSNKRMWIKIGINCLFSGILTTFIISTNVYREAAIIYILMFYIWIDRKKEDEKIEKIINIFVTFMLCMAVISSIINISSDIKYKKSNAYDMAKYINEQEKSVIIVGERTEYATAIVPYLKSSKIYHIQRGEYITYTVWDEIYKKSMTIEDVKKSINILNENNLYYLCCIYKNVNGSNIDYEKDIINQLKDENILEEIYATNGNSMWKEDYILYKINR